MHQIVNNQGIRFTSSVSSKFTELSNPSTNLLSLITDNLLLACLISSLLFGEEVLAGEPNLQLKLYKDTHIKKVL